MNHGDKTYSILALDDHPVVLEGIAHLLADYSVSTVGTTADMLSLLREGRTFRLFILDLELPGADGFKVLQDIRQTCPDASILIYTMHEEPWIVARIASLDIQGVVSKSRPVSELRQAVEAIRLGGTFFDENFTEQLKNVSKPVASPQAFQLSEREQQVLQGIAEGLTTQEMSERFFISTNTIGTYRRRLMAKFNVHNVAQLIIKARRFIEPQTAI